MGIDRLGSLEYLFWSCSAMELELRDDWSTVVGYTVVSCCCWFCFANFFPSQRFIQLFLSRDLCVRIDKVLEHPQKEGQPSVDVLQLQQQCLNRCVGLLHAVGIFPLALAIYATSFQDNSYIGKPTILSDITCAMTGGYFLWDVLVILSHWNKESLQWIVHALISGTALGPPMLFKLFPLFFVGGLLLHEASTPFMAIRWFYTKFGMGKDPRCIIATIGFVFSFIAIRIVWAPMFLYRYLFSFLTSNEGQRLFGNELCLWYMSSVVLFYLLNVYWAYAIVKTALNRKRDI